MALQSTVASILGSAHDRVVGSTFKVGPNQTIKRGQFRLAKSPVVITRHGDTVGYYLPARRRRSEAERAELKEAAARLQEMLLAEGISEDEIIADFKRWRAGGRK